jgi:hypothetical protein
VSVNRVSIGERRAAIRRRTLEEHGIERARVRAGRDAVVLDVSAAGIFIETVHRLLPGTTIELQLTFIDRCTSIRGRVVRSTVASLRFGRVLYRGAVAFEQRLVSFPAIEGYAVPAAATSDRLLGREDATHPTR